jgi:hypothetical protein
MNEIKKNSQVTEIISYGTEIISCEKKILKPFLKKISQEMEIFSCVMKIISCEKFF